MSWQNVDVSSSSDQFETYQKKYGALSDYQKDQANIYNHPEIAESFRKIASLLKIEGEGTLLNIGINNGYEMQIIESSFQIPLYKHRNIIGFDLAEDALRIAAQHFRGSFIKGDIRDFQGTNVITGNQEKIEDGSIDTVISLLTLQSSSLNQTLETFISTLVRKMKSSSELLIGIPNFHINDRGEICLGLFEAKTKTINLASAIHISEKLVSKLESCGYYSETRGDLVRFYYFSRK